MPFDDGKKTVSGAIAHTDDAAAKVPFVSVKCGISPTLSGVSSVVCTQAGKNLLDTANAETKSNNSVSVICDGNGKYTATGTATGGSANITFTLKTPCTIKSGMYLHLMNSGASGSVSITLQKQDNTTIYAPALSPANRIADLSSYAGQTIYSIRFYIANGASFEMTLTPMACFSNTATTYEPYQTPTVYNASLGRTIYGGTADIVTGEGTDENGNDFTFTPITPTPETVGKVNNVYCNTGNTELTYYDNAHGFSEVTVNKNGVSQTAYLHKVIYGGKADVINGTAKPKNLFNDKNLTQGLPATTIGSSIDTINTSTIRYSYNGFVPPNGNIAISAERNDTDVVAAILFYGYKDGLLTDYRGINPFGTNPVTIDCSSFDYVRITVGSVNAQTQSPLDMTDYGYIQAEVGSSKSDYAPYFAPFTFPPISMETDEGENTLFANEGGSAITYRKDTE